LDQYAQPVRVPQLVVWDGDRYRLFEPWELDEFEWNLNDCDPHIPKANGVVEMTIGDRTALYLAEDGGGVRIGAVEPVIVRQLSLATEGDDWSKQELVRWLDGEIHHGGALAGLAKSESQAWLQRVVDGLLTEHQADLAILVRKRHEIADVLIAKIAEHGRKQVRRAAEMLIDGRSARRLETSMDAAKVLSEPDYCPYHRYKGPFTFPKHAFDLIGEMGKEDEPDCARRINDHINVKRWIRNLEQESAGGFSLPLSPGRFFPDFIAELEDGRIAIVEYKNAKLAQTKEEQHKKSVGELWEARSSGKCVFAWVVERDWATLDARLSPGST